MDAARRSAKRSWLRRRGKLLKRAAPVPRGQRENCLSPGAPYVLVAWYGSCLLPPPPCRVNNIFSYYILPKADAPPARPGRCDSTATGSTRASPTVATTAQTSTRTRRHPCARRRRRGLRSRRRRGRGRRSAGAPLPSRRRTCARSCAGKARRWRRRVLARCGAAARAERVSAVVSATPTERVSAWAGSNHP